MVLNFDKVNRVALAKSDTLTQMIYTIQLSENLSKKLLNSSLSL
jgi:hypothetical protein